jgi:hypothetical protein
LSAPINIILTYLVDLYQKYSIIHRGSIYLTIKLLLAGVLSAIKGMAGIITALDNRVKTMNHDVVRIDTIVSNALGLRPDVDRIARADGKNDARRD